jgi:hypothetical protein
MRPRCTKRKGFSAFTQAIWNRLADRQHRRFGYFIQVKSNTYLTHYQSPGLLAVLVCQNSRLRDGHANQKSTPETKLFRKPIRKPARKTDGNNVPLAVRCSPDWDRQEAAFYCGKGQP